MTRRTITAYAFDYHYGDDVVPVYALVMVPCDCIVTAP